MKRTGVDRLAVASGVLLVLLPLLPLARWAAAEDSGPPWKEYGESWLIGGVLLLVIGGACGRYLAGWRPRLPRLAPRAVVPLLALFTLVGSLGMMFYAFAGRPHLVDEMAQLFQARVFAAGMLAAPVPEFPAFFLLPNTFVTDAGWISQYPPGGSALLALAMLVNAPWLLNPVMGAVGVGLVFVVARNLFDERTGLLAALLWATSAWVLTMSGTYMNHAAATTLALVTWSLTIGRDEVSPRMLLLAGFTAALAASIRPLDGAIAAIPVLIWWWGSPMRLSRSALLVLGGIPVILLWGWFNAETLGRPLALGYLENFGPEHSLGFHEDPFGVDFTPAIGLANASSALRRLNIYLFEWPLPALVPLGAWLLLAGGRGRAELMLLSVVTVTPLVYLFYFHSGFYPGPRFYYVAAPFFVIATARALIWARDALPEGEQIRWRTAFTSMVLLTLGWSAAVGLPDRARAWRGNLPAVKVDPRGDLADLGVARALVLVPESWGSRVMARMWGAGVPAGVAERAYRRTDLCRLDRLISLAELRGPGAVVADLTAHTDSGPPPLQPLADAPDPSTRLVDLENLRPECVTELRRDLGGFALFPIAGWSNDIGLEGDVVFARDMYERNQPLLQHYADRPVWRFAPPPGYPDSLPRLERIEDAGN